MASMTISDLPPVGSELLLDSQLFQTLTDEEAKKIAGGFATEFGYAGGYAGGFDTATVVNVYKDGLLISSTDDGIDNGVTVNIYGYSP